MDELFGADIERRIDLDGDVARLLDRVCLLVGVDDFQFRRGDGFGGAVFAQRSGQHDVERLPLSGGKVQAKQPTLAFLLDDPLERLRRAQPVEPQIFRHGDSQTVDRPAIDAHAGCGFPACAAARKFASTVCNSADNVRRDGSRRKLDRERRRGKAIDLKRQECPEGFRRCRHLRPPGMHRHRRAIAPSALSVRSSNSGLRRIVNSPDCCAAPSTLSTGAVNSANSPLADSASPRKSDRERLGCLVPL